MPAVIHPRSSARATGSGRLAWTRHLIRLGSAFSVLAVISACSSVGTTVLAVESAVRSDAATIEVEVECADSVEASVEMDAGTEGHPLVTVRGEPRAGRCAVPVRVDLPADITAVEDAATGMVVEIDGTGS